MDIIQAISLFIHYFVSRLEVLLIVQVFFFTRLHIFIGASRYQSVLIFKLLSLECSYFLYFQKKGVNKNIKLKSKRNQKTIEH